MKTLYLVRHAKSSWKYEGLSDFQRPLNKRGKNDAPLMADLLADKGVKPAVLVSSPAERAITTARVFAGALGYSEAAIVAEAGIYEAGVSRLMGIIQDLDDQHDSAMLFGHNPGFTWIANDLAGAAIDNVPTCGVVTIVFQIKRWQQIKPRTGELQAFDFPKKYFY